MWSQEKCCLFPTSAKAVKRPWLLYFRHLFPERTIVVVTDGLKRQEVVQQDLETWIAEGQKGAKDPRPRPQFYPAWEVFPHESRLPHADVISERLETLAALTNSKRSLIVTNAIALMQRTFDAGDLRQRTRTIKKGETIEMLDLIEWLEDQGYEPEAQVTQKGRSLRGGIIDLWPLTSPWPVRLEFFGDELESLRYFDPITQISQSRNPKHPRPTRRRTRYPQTIGNFCAARS